MRVTVMEADGTLAAADVKPPQDVYTPDASSTAERVSYAIGEEMVRYGGLGYIPKRGLSNRALAELMTANGAKALALRNPIELLKYLVYVSPELALSLWTNLRLCTTPGAVRLKAMTTEKPTPDEVADNKALGKLKADASGKYPARESAQGTAIIEEFFKNLPQEVNGLTGALTQQLQTVLFEASAMAECVPFAGEKGTGEYWPIVPGTTEFRRETNGRFTGHLVLDQRQVTASEQGGYIGNGQMVPLPMERTFWSALDPTPDNPGGIAPYAPVLGEILVNMAILRDIVLAFHRLGVPNADISFDFRLWTEMCTLITGEQDPVAIGKWVMRQFKNVQKQYESKKPDSAFWHDIGTTVNLTKTAESWPDFTGLLSYQRWRIVAGLKELNTIMGVPDSQETKAGIEWKIKTAGLESLVLCAIQPCIAAAQYILQDIYGLPYTVEAEIEPIRANDRLTEAQATEIEYRNETFARDQGWQSNDDASIKSTGSPALSEPVVQTQPTGGKNDKSANNPATQGSGDNPQSGDARPTVAESRRIERWRTLRARARSYEEQGIEAEETA